MRTKVALIFCLVCLSGCVGVRQHWTDGFGWMWDNSAGQIIRHAPVIAGAAAVGAADGAIDHAVYGHETPREWQERKIDEMSEGD